jgi:hypothetical protein
VTRWRFLRTDSRCVVNGAVSGRHRAYVQRDSTTSGPAGLVCAHCRLPSYVRLAPLVVEAPTFFDARAEAQSVFHTTALTHAETEEAPEVCVLWEGTDVNRRTGADGRRKVVERALHARPM